MNIRRQYSLPNCIVTLEGLDPSGTGEGSARPPLSVLLGAECRFASTGRAITGDRAFFEQLARAVSLYAQELLSGVRSPQLPPPAAPPSDAAPVNLYRTENNRHHLAARSTAPEGDGQAAQAELVELDLTPIQFFDLVEAIDQFYADSQTLPDVKLVLTPVARRSVPAKEPTLQRAAPALVGVAGLLVAGGVLFLPPVPQVDRPEEPDGEAVSPEAVPDAAPASPPAPEPSPEDATLEPLVPDGEGMGEADGDGDADATEGEPGPEAAEAETSQAETPAIAGAETAGGEILDPNQLAALNRNLYGQLDEAWDDRGAAEETLTYRVSVGRDGAIVGYSPEDAAARDGSGTTPLPELLFNPVDREAEGEPLALFSVVFTQNGVLQVSPARGYPSEPDPPPPIEDAAQRDRLRQALEAALAEGWTAPDDLDEAAVFSVQVNAEGEIANYEPENDAARELGGRVPLSGAIDLGAGAAQAPDGTVVLAPVASFRVAFGPDGTVTATDAP